MRLSGVGVVQARDTRLHLVALVKHKTMPQPDAFPRGNQRGRLGLILVERFYSERIHGKKAVCAHMPAIREPECGGECTGPPVPESFGDVSGHFESRSSQNAGAPGGGRHEYVQNRGPCEMTRNSMADGCVECCIEVLLFLMVYG